MARLSFSVAAAFKIKTCCIFAPFLCIRGKFACDWASVVPSPVTSDRFRILFALRDRDQCVFSIDAPLFRVSLQDDSFLESIYFAMSFVRWASRIVSANSTAKINRNIQENNGSIEEQREFTVILLKASKEIAGIATGSATCCLIYLSPPLDLSDYRRGSM